MQTSRSAEFELDDGGIYNTKEPYHLFLNGEEWTTTEKVITGIYGLLPDQEYHLQVRCCSGTPAGDLVFRTDREFVTLNVKDFGAAGDGVRDDTASIQAAIMACPPMSRVVIPEGTYRITSLFLRSHMNLELQKGAKLCADTDRWRYARFPGSVFGYDGKTEYHLGTWEGDPAPMFAGIITGIDVCDVAIYGEGEIDGCADHENWWKDPKVMVGAYRPRMIFLNRCSNIRIQGIHLHDSPAWVVHPYFSEDLMFADLFIENPQISPNTDGIDPESCRNVEIIGTHFSLGDDCIAVKSGKYYMGRKYKRAAENTHIYQCFMENGHGAVTIGSEVGAGVKNLVAEKCRFAHTDRGLRIKTRRGRGEDSVIDEITFRDIEMDQVLTPFTANAFYFCDPDGMSDYVQSREFCPVDERTPVMGSFHFENIHAAGCHAAGTYFLGLPESRIELLEMRNCSISYAEDAVEFVPVMAKGVDPCRKKRIHAEFVKKLILDHVQIDGFEGEPYELNQVEEFVCS